MLSYFHAHAHDLIWLMYHIRAYVNKEVIPMLPVWNSNVICQSSYLCVKYMSRNSLYTLTSVRTISIAPTTTWDAKIKYLQRKLNVHARYLQFGRMYRCLAKR